MFEYVALVLLSAYAVVASFSLRKAKRLVTTVNGEKKTLQQQKELSDSEALKLRKEELRKQAARLKAQELVAKKKTGQQSAPTKKLIEYSSEVRDCEYFIGMLDGRLTLMNSHDFVEVFFHEHQVVERCTLCNAERVVDKKLST